MIKKIKIISSLIIFVACCVLILLVLISLSGNNRGFHTLKIPEGKKIINAKLSPDSEYGSSYVGRRG